MKSAPDISVRRALLVRNAHSYDFGGAERFPVDLAVLLQHHDIEPIVVSRNKKLLFYAREQNIRRIRGWWWSRQNWSGISALLFPVYLGWQLLLAGWYLRLITQLRPEVIHLQSKDDFIAGTLAGRLLRKKVIWTDHADLKYVYANHQIWYKNPVGKLVYLCSQWADNITLVSNGERIAIEQQLGKSLTDTYTVIHNGVIDRPVAVSDTDPAAFTYCSTSRLVTAKGIRELIEAFQSLNDKYPDTKLLVVGDGPERATFTELASDNNAIVFVGHSDNPLDYLAASDVFVHPSYHEGFSLSIVEAAMLGKPIIACNVGGNPEIINDQQNGLLIPAQSSDALLAAMDRLYTDRKFAKKLGSAARQTYEASFDFTKLVKERFLALYED